MFVDYRWSDWNIGLGRSMCCLFIRLICIVCLFVWDVVGYVWKCC